MQRSQLGLSSHRKLAGYVPNEGLIVGRYPLSVDNDINQLHCKREIIRKL